MKTSLRMFVASLAISLAPTLTAGPLTIAQYPLFLSTAIRPNVLVIMDNSESMDGTMAGKLIAGDDPTTRGNIARSVIRNTITSFGGQFNWGLESFYIGGPGLYSTYPYWLGSDTTMVFTDDCVAGISASNSNLRCIANPQWAGTTGTGDQYVTYDRASDDPDINDVLYIGYFGTGAWATTVGLGSGTYNFWFTHNTGPAFEANLTNYWTGLTFSPTDAGYIPFNPPITRQLYAYRAWGFYADVYGAGVINEPVLPSSNAGHIANIQTLLAQETQWGPDIKNAAVFTPLAGSLITARDYFAGGSTPITLACQKNFVMLATDGNPTARSYSWDNMYSLADQANTFTPTPAPGTWTFSPAASDVFAAVAPLRSVNVGVTTYDIQTYVVGLGDTVANPSSIATLDEVAKQGGTFKAYLAGDTASLAAAFLAISNDIAAKTSAAAAVSLNSGSWGTGSNLYQARFNSGDWTGQLIAYAINADGSIGAKLWDAGQTINGQSYTSRVILTYKPSAAFGFRGVAFRWPGTPATPTATELDVAQSSFLAQDAIGIADSFGQDRLQYLRGDVTRELLTCPLCVPAFRSRPVSRLGDIIHSAPNYVAIPPFGYPDSFEAVPYSGFVAAKSSRTPIIYVGANDGMLHGFDASSGKEVMAYVPSSVYRNLSSLTGQSFSNSAGAPHHYFVDGSPTVGDLFYGGSWHTMLVGGLAAGGQGVFALDVTDPSTFTETNAKSIVRWEFNDSNDRDLGSVFSQPLIVKTKNNKWAVIVANGYNNTDADGYASTTGHAVLFVLDAQNGTVLAKIDTGVGTVANPNGLSGAIAIDSAGNGVADTVYAGDLYGNMWKFDLSSGSPLGWKVGLGGSPLFTTPGGQPITVPPDVTKFPTGGYVVAFGTGRYLDIGDPTTTATQAFYGIRDDGAPVAMADLVGQSIVGTATGVDGNTYRITTHAVGPALNDSAVPGDNAIPRSTYDATKHGWYLNLPEPGERAVTEPSIRAGRVIFNTLTPNTDPCGYGGSSWVMEVDVMTGNRFDTQTFDTNGDKSITSGDSVLYGLGADITSGRHVDSIAAAAGFLGIPKPKGQASYENKYVNTSGGKVEVIGETAGLGSQGRASWRQVQ